MIKVENLKKSFDGFYALNGVNLNVEKGSIYALVGPNGAGKSTLIRHLTGVYRQDEGTISIDGQPVYENEEIKKRIAYIPDDLFYFMQANVQDMMKFYKGIYKSFNTERFNKLLGVFELINNKKPIRRMSKGMQKQAAFLLAISTMADIVILDEPVDGLDPVMRRQVWSLLMQDVVERGTTVLLSSHNLRELEDVCDTVGIMNKGKVLLEKSLTSLQGTVTKLQIAFSNTPDEILKAVEYFETVHKSGNVDTEKKEEGLKKFFIKDMEILHAQKNGSIFSVILRGDNAEVVNKVAELNPTLAEALPLTLEEIFIYELGGENYAVKEILL